MHILFLVAFTFISFFAKAQFTVNDSIVPAYCFNNDGKVLISISGGQEPYTVLYQFSPYDSIAGIYSTDTLAIENLSSGFSGTIVIYDANNTQMTYNFNLPYLSSPNASIDSIFDPTCNGICNGKVFISGYNGTPPYNIGISNQGPAAFLKSTNEFDNLCGGYYNVYISDACGISNSSNFYINTPLTAGLYVDIRNNITNCTSNDGSIYAGVESSDTTYTFLWSNSQTTDTIYNIGPGIYGVTVTNSAGCSESRTYEFNISGSYATVTDLQQPLCYGQSNGILTVTGILPPQDMNPPYTYFWNQVEGTDTINNAHAGDYTIEVHDPVSGCSVFATYTLYQPDSIYLTNEFNNNNCWGDSTGWVSIYSVMGGTYPYVYLWNNDTIYDQYNLNFYNLPMGTDTFTVIDANGCHYNKIFNITQPDSFYTHLTKFDVSCFGFNDGHTIIHSYGGTPEYHYFIDTLNYDNAYNQFYMDSISLSLSIGQHRIYSIDYNYCRIDSFDLEILEPTKLVVDTVGIVNPTCLNNDGSIYFDGNGGTLPYTFLINSNNASNNNTGLPGSQYLVEVTDANGCISDSTVSLVRLSQPPVIKGTVLFNSQLIDSSKVILLVPGQFGAAQMDTLTFSQGSAFNFANLTPGEYFLKAVYFGQSQNALSTYYNDKLYWSDADTIHANCDDTLTADINLASLPTTSGSCDISGYVRFVYNYGTKAASEPVPGAEIAVEQVPGPTTIKMALTDSTGFYNLSDLPDLPNCNLRVDIPGFPMLSTYTGLSLSAGSNDSLGNMNFIVDTTLFGGIMVDSALWANPLINNTAKVTISPNPFSTQANIDIYINNDEKANIKVISLQGNTIYTFTPQYLQKGKNVLTLQKSQVPVSGAYYLIIQTSKYTYVKKFIKQ